MRARTLATISCGTGWRVAVAAPIAILTGDAWRAAYLGFAACAVLSTLPAACTLPGRTGVPAPAPTVAPAAPDWRPSALPMFTATLLIGLGSSKFWTVAVDQVRDAGLAQAHRPNTAGA